MMTAGVSTACFYPLETKDALRTLLEGGVRQAEVFLNAPTEAGEPYLDGLRELCRRHEAQVISLHPFTSEMETLFFFSDYPYRFQDGLVFYRQLFSAARCLGARYFVLHGEFAMSRLPLQESCRRVAALRKVAWEEYGVELLQENVQRCKGGHPEYWDALLQQEPEQRFVLDIKQALRAGQDPFAFVHMAGGRIAHLHLSDNAPGQDCLPLGEGSFDLAGLLELLGRQGFDGSAVVELYRHSYQQVEQVFQSYQNLCSLLQQIPGSST